MATRGIPAGMAVLARLVIREHQDFVSAMSRATARA